MGIPIQGKPAYVLRRGPECLLLTLVQSMEQDAGKCVLSAVPQLPQRYDGTASGHQSIAYIGAPHCSSYHTAVEGCKRAGNYHINNSTGGPCSVLLVGHTAMSYMSMITGGQCSVLLVGHTAMSYMSMITGGQCYWWGTQQCPTWAWSQVASVQCSWWAHSNVLHEHDHRWPVFLVGTHQCPTWAWSQLASVQCYWWGTQQCPTWAWSQVASVTGGAHSNVLHEHDHRWPVFSVTGGAHSNVLHEHDHRWPVFSVTGGAHSNVLHEHDDSLLFSLLLKVMQALFHCSANLQSQNLGPLNCEWSDLNKINKQ